MILIRSNFQKFHLISLFDIQTHFLQHPINLTIKHRSPVLGWKHQMVDQYRYIMTLMYILTHIEILRRKRRGIEPQGIQLIEGRPEYLRMSTPSYLLGWLYERVVNSSEVFARFRVVLVCALEKPL